MFEILPCNFYTRCNDEKTKEKGRKKFYTSCGRLEPRIKGKEREREGELKLCAVRGLTAWQNLESVTAD